MGKERTLRAPTGAILSKYLRSLALDMETVNDEGDPVTKAAALAKFVWQAALGYRTVDVKNGSVIVHEPDWRAIELLYNRIEGKVPVAPPEDNSQSLADKVSDLGKARANSLARAATENAEAGVEPEEEDDDGV
jgi:type III secretory pathway component EscU